MMFQFVNIFSGLAMAGAMDLSVHSVNKDNNNDISVVDLSISKTDHHPSRNDDIKDEPASAADKLRALLPHLDIATLNILCLARLQVRKESCLRDKLSEIHLIMMVMMIVSLFVC